jgi:Tfp pilus assembly protein PilO
VFLDRFSARERRLAGVTLAVVVAFVVFRAYVAPAAARWRHLKDQVAAAQAEVTVMEATLKLKKRIDKEYEGFQALLAGSRSDEEDMAALLKEVYEAATQNSVDVYSIDPLPTEYREACRLLGARLVLRGRIVPFCRFSQRLGSASSLTFMRDLEIRALSEAPNLQVTVTVVRMATRTESAKGMEETVSR